MTTRRHFLNNDNPFSGKAELKPLTQEDVSLDMIDSSSTTTAATITAATASKNGTDLEANRSQSLSPLSIDNNNTAAVANDNLLDHWVNHDYAVGLVEPTWRDEIKRRHTNTTGNNDNNNDIEANGPNRECCADAGNSEMDPTCGCLFISGIVCGRLGFGRIGNMVILKERVVYDTNHKGEKVPKRVLDCIVGPYWPMLVFVTYPLVLGVSYWTAKRAIFVPNGHPWAVVCMWLVLTVGLCLSLFWVSCSDPGILPKYHVVPSSNGGGIDGATGCGHEKRESNNMNSWRWNDRVQSYVPRGAFYDSDCAVVVEEFDHTCPWTGTAIGKKNMFAFQLFIFFLFSCLIMDVILLTSAS